MPAGADFADAQARYQNWKTDLLTADGAGGFLRVKRPNSGTQVNSSNSEGIGYGMEIAVYMDDQATFDKLWQYEQIHRGTNGLMDWEISPTGGVLGSGAASDGDEDMAFALVMADKKWGGQGSLSDTYLNHAKKLIDLIFAARGRSHAKRRAHARRWVRRWPDHQHFLLCAGILSDLRAGDGQDQ